MNRKGKTKKQTPKSPQKSVYNNVVDSMINQPPQKNDPLGSYTGKPLDINEVPTQDADDL